MLDSPTILITKTKFDSPYQNHGFWITNAKNYEKIGQIYKIGRFGDWSYSDNTFQVGHDMWRASVCRNINDALTKLLFYKYDNSFSSYKIIEST